MGQLSGKLVTPQGILEGQLSFKKVIERLESSPIHASGPYILPGFIDTHVHGGGGGDTMDGVEGVRTLAKFHLCHGTTTLYPTTITNPWSSIMNALCGVKEVVQEGGDASPDIPGAHLEGPFISPNRLGAQPPNTYEPTQERLDELLDLGIIKIATLAPEISGSHLAARRFAAADVRVSVGHTNASYEEVTALTKLVTEAGGTVGFTHLYNAMGGLSGRKPGVVGAALADSKAHTELIFDLHHVHAGSFLAAFRAKPKRLHFVTDAIRACGLDEGETELGGQKVLVKDGAARLEDGTLAGSVLTLDVALRNALELGLSLNETSRLLSATPANYMGLADRGTLETGNRADIVVLNEAFEVQEVFVAGRKVVG